MKATQISAIKEKLAEKGMAKAVFIFCQAEAQVASVGGLHYHCKPSSCLSTGQEGCARELVSQVTFQASV